MKESKFTILNEEGLHSRPAADFCSEAAKYESQVTLTKEGDGSEYDGKSILMVMCLGACKGDVITVRTEGPDEEQALNALIDVLKKA